VHTALAIGDILRQQGYDTSWYGGARGLEGEPSRPAGGRLAANFSTPPGEPIGRDAIGDGVLPRRQDRTLGCAAERQSG
jgi:hypothetical protein